MLLVPWIDPTKIALTAYAIDLRGKQSEQEVFQLDNSSHLFGTFAASRMHKQEVRWDVTEMIIDLQRRKNSSWFPLILIMNCLDQNCRFSHDSWRLHTHPAFSNLILLPETQAVLELYTQSTIGLVKLYGDRRVQKRSIPSPDSDCPSFLDPNVRHTRCCLFRFTLNKQQMDQNDMLRFIIFPHHLPINLCHGRCIGVYIPRDNTHSLLLNRYFAGLNDKEREILYNSMPCCAANETSPFTIVYKTRDNLLVTDTLQKAVKMSCACG
ncbi:hypothetical protein P879_08037 [Paragonimus westermani]|uniref:TGF-beta family profile domain-containing protein n=1 Tax=Paragonimus westermani TaxID=34504 RepID=A0A8T0CZ16_9TREM|nr:hypothetical protein P879_08037 [Paragonimus westermani]